MNIHRRICEPRRLQAGSERHFAMFVNEGRVRQDREADEHCGVADEEDRTGCEIRGSHERQYQYLVVEAFSLATGRMAVLSDSQDAIIRLRVVTPLRPISYDLRCCNETCRGQLLKHCRSLAIEVILSVVKRIPFRGMHNAVFVFRWTVDRIELQGLMTGIPNIVFGP